MLTVGRRSAMTPSSTTAVQRDGGVAIAALDDVEIEAGIEDVEVEVSQEQEDIEQENEAEQRGLYYPTGWTR